MKKRRERKSILVSIDLETLEKLDKTSNKLDITRSRAIKVAVLAWMEEMKINRRTAA